MKYIFIFVILAAGFVAFIIYSRYHPKKNYKYATEQECETQSASRCDCMVTQIDSPSSNPFCVSWEPCH